MYLSDMHIRILHASHPVEQQEHNSNESEQVAPPSLTAGGATPRCVGVLGDTPAIYVTECKNKLPQECLSFSNSKVRI